MYTQRAVYTVAGVKHILLSSVSFTVCVLLLGHSQTCQLPKDHFPFKWITKGDFYSQPFGAQLSGEQEGTKCELSVLTATAGVYPPWVKLQNPSYRKREREG